MGLFSDVVYPSSCTLACRAPDMQRTPVFEQRSFPPLASAILAFPACSFTVYPNQHIWKISRVQFCFFR